MRSIRLPGFEFVDHAPEPVALAALDYLQRGRAIEGGIGLEQPWTNVLGIDEAGKRFKQTLQLRQFL